MVDSTTCWLHSCAEPVLRPSHASTARALAGPGTALARPGVHFRPHLVLQRPAPFLLVPLRARQARGEQDGPLLPAYSHPPGSRAWALNGACLGFQPASLVAHARPPAHLHQPHQPSHPLKPPTLFSVSSTKYRLEKVVGAAAIGGGRGGGWAERRTGGCTRWCGHMGRGRHAGRASRAGGQLLLPADTAGAPSKRPAGRASKRPAGIASALLQASHRWSRGPQTRSGRRGCAARGWVGGAWGPALVSTRRRSARCCCTGRAAPGASPPACSALLPMPCGRPMLPRARTSGPACARRTAPRFPGR